MSRYPGRQVTRDAVHMGRRIAPHVRRMRERREAASAAADEVLRRVMRSQSKETNTGGIR